MCNEAENSIYLILIAYAETTMGHGPILGLSGKNVQAATVSDKGHVDVVAPDRASLQSIFKAGAIGYGGAYDYV